MNKKRLMFVTTLLLVVSEGAIADHQSDVLTLQRQWELVKYRTPAGAQAEAYERLVKAAETMVLANPGQADVLIWKGIVLASYAGAKGGLGALSVVKESRQALEQAIAIDPDALQGSAYTTLGSLYYQVPSWPIGFGDDGKALEYLQKALALNPDGIDPNFWYGSFLVDQGRYAEALNALQRAKAAAPRPGRELADEGRRREIEDLIAQIRNERQG